MSQVIFPKEMGQLERASGISEEELMERAGRGIADEARALLLGSAAPWKVLLLVGKGHNGADALVAGRCLLQQGIPVLAWPLCSKEECRPLTALNWQRFVEAGGALIDAPPPCQAPLEIGLILDGLLGTGFRGALSPAYVHAIEWANASSIDVFSIDIPSGVNGSDGSAPSAVYAKKTLAMGLPKIGCFIKEGWKYSGELKVVPLGIDLSSASGPFRLLEEGEARSSLPKIERLRHKHSIGPLAILAGSPHMEGAAKLASLAAYRAGAGLVRRLLAQSLPRPMDGMPWEVVFEVCSEEFLKHRALLLGPGLSLDSETVFLLKRCLATDVPKVIDASALTWLAQEKAAIPKGSVLTPHLGEFNRLLSVPGSLVDLDLLQEAAHYASNAQVTLVLKGAPTFIFHPSEQGRICLLGDPGMATAGSGDVLSGIIASFLAQGAAPWQAALAGVYLHGLSGQLAARELTSYSLMASDLIAYLPKAFHTLLKSIIR
ncbi:MAG: YjeF family protein [Chlamydiales bacterium]|jgi:NAD(P)H-hydrate epimerase|nr:YjeF family protein [Chlamydiales bacterium]